MQIDHVSMTVQESILCNYIINGDIYYILESEQFFIFYA